MDAAQWTLRTRAAADTVRQQRMKFGSAVLVVAIHLVLISVFALQSIAIPVPASAEQLIEVALYEAPKPSLNEAPPKPQLLPVRLVLPAVPPPEVRIVEPDPPIEVSATTANADSVEFASGDSDQGKSEYVARLREHLLRFMHFPGAEGVATLRFFIDRSGHVVRAEIATSSGSDAVDREALALLQRADPLPPIPDELRMQTFGALLPVAYQFTKTAQRGTEAVR